MLILFDLKIKTNIESAGIDPTFPTKLKLKPIFFPSQTVE